MPAITLADGSIKSFDHDVTLAEVAMAIGPGLAKVALAGEIAGKLYDMSYVLSADCALRLITDKDAEGLEIIRHSSAHLLAHAVQLLYEDAQVTIGPVIENGFYYDFHYPPGFSDKDLADIEACMSDIVKKNYVIERIEMPRDEAVTLFTDMGEKYKAEIIASIPTDEAITLYKQDTFTDLCRGPHVPNTGMLKAFKLTKVAGAYWRGDSNNEMLQRIYGTAWPDKKQLKAYLALQAEAERRDHRKGLVKFDLGHFSELAPGMFFWHENGWVIYREIQKYLTERFEESDYHLVSTPQLVDVKLWEASGHLDKFSDDMFLLDTANRQYAIKPMNCPCHVEIYKQGKRSYRELPLRLAEYGSCHRNEPSGALHGLMRLRNFVQDDGHIFCTTDQIHDEVCGFIKQLQAIYHDFGFTDIQVKLSTRPEKRVGTDAMWDKSEAVLSGILDSMSLDWALLPGEGAFYGPKIEFSLKDCIGRLWQCGTVQLDFSMPERLDAQYIDDTGSALPPVMIHRATLGSIERFIGILLEHYDKQLPLWLTPKQVIVLNITDNQVEYAEKIVNTLKKQGIRAHKDLRNEKIGYKIRTYSLEHIPYMIIVGDKEMEQDTVSVRIVGGDQLEGISLTDFLARLQEEIKQRCVAGGQKH
jgi:threonyl-tRNA synthetase